MRFIARRAQSIYLRSISYVILCVAVFSFHSCGDQVSRQNHARITFPDTKSIQQFGYRTVLCADQVVEWTSSIDGDLGSGAEITCVLSVGYHEICIFDDGEKCDSIFLTILPLQNEETYRLDIQGNSPQIIIPSGTYCPVYVASDGMKADLTMSVGNVQTKNHDFSIAPTVISGVSLPTVVRDISFEFLSSGQPVRSFVEEHDRFTRIFKFPDITGKSTGKGVEISAERVWTSLALDVWIDDRATVEDEIINMLSEMIQTRILAKHLRIWGTWLDINNDKKLCILMTPEFNASKTAIGLFNTADFYAFNNAVDDSEYNPNSNEMDMLYIACPDVSGGNPGYSINGIMATVAHELQHLTDYSVICSQQRKYEMPTPEIEEVFLEEGLSHLAETLSGYGESGGNIAFVARYLQKTASTPLGTYLEAGYGDSVERRGGMALLLSWIYEREENANPGGGIAWIQRLYASRKRGWSRIEDSVGKKRHQILEDFSFFLGTQASNEIRRDSLTGEALAIDPYSGVVNTLGTTVTLAGPSRVQFGDSVMLAPYAVAFGVPFSVSIESSVNVTRSTTDNNVRLILRKQ